MLITGGYTLSSDSDDVQDSNTPPMPSEPPPEHRQPKWAWWVVGIAVPVLAILVSAALSLWGSPNSDAPADSASPSTSVSSREDGKRSAGPSKETPAPSASLPSASEHIQYTGRVRIAESGPRLDEVPPEADPYTPDAQLGLVDPPRIFTNSDDEDNLAAWTQRKTPTRRECSDLVSTQGVWKLEVKKGTVVCVKTRGGRIAVLTITSTSDSFNTGVLAQATVWSEASD